MKESSYKDYAELLLFLNADTVAKTLGVSPRQRVRAAARGGPPLAADR